MNKRRGLSSVIGMVFLVIVLSSTIGYFTYGINLIEKLQDQLVIKGIESFDQFKENFEVTNIRIDDGKFNLTIQNTGQLPINFTRLWVNNVTDNSWPIQNFTVNKVSSPGQVLNNVGQNLNLYALDSQSYTLRLVTERGNTFNVQISSPKDKALEMNLFTTPRSIITLQNVTIWYGVTNNLTDGSILQLITPQIEDPPDTTGSASATYIEGPIPTTKQSLTNGNTAFFKWIYEVNGIEGDTIAFNATINNAIQGNYVIEPVEFVGLLGTVLAQNAGLLQVDYKSLEWAQDTSDWSTGWSLNNGDDTVWRINIKNNDPTDTFYIGDDTALVMTRVASASTSVFYIGDSATTNPPTIAAYTDLSQNIAPGQELVVYFGATQPGGTNEESTPAQKGINQSPILIFGKMCSGGGCPGSGTEYGQTIPFLGILLE